MPYRPSVHPKLKDISDNNSRTVTKLQHRVVFGKTFQGIQLSMTSSQGQGHRVTLKIKKNEDLPVSWSVITVESLNFYHIFANGKAFIWTYDTMFFYLCSRSLVTLKMWENELFYIYHILNTIEYWNLNHVVAYCKTFLWTYGLLTLTFVQGHMVESKI